MTKQTKSMLETTVIVAIMGLVVSLVACLNPVGFSPEVKLSIDANVSGELDVYNSNNAVSWVINKTKSVDISSVRIEVIGPSLDGAPAKMDILGAPKAGASHASYHKPSKDKTSQPYQYEFTIDTVVVGNPSDFPGLNLVQGERKSFSLKKFMPRAQDYAVFLIRKADGSLEFVDEEPPISALDDNDLTNPPVPPGPGTGRYPLIVRNVTKSADVMEVNFEGMPFAQDVIANVNDQKSFHMKADEYGPTFIKYRVNRTGDVKETFHQNESPRVVVIDPTVTDAQSWHLLFLYFYKSRDGSYKITQQWPPIPDDSDPEDTISNNYTDTRVRVLNKVGMTEVTGIAITKDRSTFYGVNSDDFSPAGVITGGGFDWNAHSKSAIFEPAHTPGIGPFIGEPYEIWIRLTDKRLNGRQGEIYIKRTGVNLWLGNTYNIIISKDDVKEGEDVTVIPPLPVSYVLMANGGTGPDTLPAYDTTEVTVTFVAPKPGATFQKVSDTSGATLGTFTTSDGGTVYKATVSGQTQSGTLTIKVSNASSIDVDPADHQTTIYLHNNPPPLPPQRVGKIILYTDVISGSFGDPTTLSFTKGKTNNFSGWFLPPGYNTAFAWTTDGLPGQSEAQAIACWGVFDLIGAAGKAELVMATTGATAGTGQHYEKSGTAAELDASKQVSVKVYAGASGSFQLKCSIPPEKNGGVTVTKTVTVNIK